MTRLIAGASRLCAVGVVVLGVGLSACSTQPVPSSPRPAGTASGVGTAPTAVPPSRALPPPGAVATSAAGSGAPASIDIAATAVALGQGAGGAAPRPTSPVVGRDARGTPLPTAAPGALTGRVLLARDDAIVVLEAGATKVVYTPRQGSAVKDPAWSPDGRTIAFAFAPPRPTPRAGQPVAEQLFSSDIMLVDADGANPRIVAAHDVVGAILESPAWSADGKSLLYSYYAPTYKGEQLASEVLEVRRQHLDGSAASTVVRNASGPSASPDGKWLVYSGEDPAEGQSLRVRPIGGGPERVLVKPDQFAAMLAPRVSPDGQSVAFAASPLPSIGAPSGTPRAGAPIDWLRWLVAPAAAEAHGFPWEIYLVPTAGGPARQLTQIGEDSPYAAWAPDGSRLLVVGGGGMYLVDARDGHTQAVSTRGSHGGMDWRAGP